MALDFTEDLVELRTGGRGDSLLIEHLLYLKRGEVPYLNLGLETQCFGYNTSLSQAVMQAYPWLGDLDIQEVDADRVKVAGIDLSKAKIGVDRV